MQAAKISVCVPARNEASSLPSLLESLFRQTHPPAEVVIADGGSTDETMDIAQSYATRGVRVLDIGPAFPGHGRNRAIEAASHDWLALIDAGCVADPRWLEKLSEAAVSGLAPVVFGHYEPRIRSNWDKAQALTLVPPVDPITLCRPPFIASSLIHRRAWEATKGFPEDLRAAEDLVFFERLAAQRIKSVRCPEAIVTWALPATPTQMFIRLRQYSGYHLAAGLGHTWHTRVMGMDLLGLLAVGAALAWPPSILIPLVAAPTRLLRSVWLRRHAVRDGAFGPAACYRAAWLLILADAATWVGAWDYFTKPHRFRRPSPAGS